MKKNLNPSLSKSQKLPIALLLIGIAFTAFLGVRQYQKQQQDLLAKQAIWPIEIYLREGNYQLALEGGGGDIGLLEIISKFPNTKTSNLAHLYAAIAYLHTKKPDKEAAIIHLESFQAQKSYIQAHIWALLGDLYSDKKAYQQALTYYEKAAQHMPNPFTTPAYLLKAAIVYEELKQYDQARLCYQRVYTLFPTCEKVQEAIKHESRVKQLAESN